MSIRWLGRARRSFIMGIRLWPPLRILGSSPCCCRRPTASGSVLGRRYSKAGGIMGPPLSTSNYCSSEQHKAAFRGGVPYITGSNAKESFSAELWQPENAQLNSRDARDYDTR